MRPHVWVCGERASLFKQGSRLLVRLRRSVATLLLHKRHNFSRGLFRPCIQVFPVSPSPCLNGIVMFSAFESQSDDCRGSKELPNPPLSCLPFGLLLRDLLLTGCRFAEGLRPLDQCYRKLSTSPELE